MANELKRIKAQVTPVEKVRERIEEAVLLWEMAEEAYNRAAEADPDNAYLYYSEFGLEHYYSWLAKHGEDMTQDDIEPVHRKCLVYLIRSLDLDEDGAKRLLS